jgi:hypothetical protein
MSSWWFGFKVYGHICHDSQTFRGWLTNMLVSRAAFKESNAACDRSRVFNRSVGDFRLMLTPPPITVAIAFIPLKWTCQFPTPSRILMVNS